MADVTIMFTFISQVHLSQSIEWYELENLLCPRSRL